MHVGRDREAFVREAYAGLFGWFRRLTGSDDEAADLTQDTFAAFWGSASRAGRGVSSRTWLYAVGRNLWRNHLRDRKQHDPLTPVASSTRPPDGVAGDREFGDATERAIAGLPTDLREAFTLRFWDGFGYDEIGTIQCVTPELARWRYFDARKKLCRTLAAWDPDRERSEEDQHAR